ncbi:MAG: hypothetical protein KAS17_02115 [Victivallaceae bacterium]|nr:hypothetical protein [Victivallaceae bacterium]
MSRIPTLIQAELIGVPLYLHKAQKTKNPHERRIAELETGIWKAHLTLSSLKNVFTDPAIAEWAERFKKKLDYPGTPWNSSHRLEILEKETEYGIELLESSIRSPVLKRLLDFLIAARDGNICEYYQQISKEEAGLIIEFSFESETNKTEDSL